MASWKALAALVGRRVGSFGSAPSGIPLAAAARRGAASVALGLAGWTLRPDDVRPPPTGLRITFLDVGQGDSALIEVPEGAVLVDEGPPEAHVEDQLRSLGVRRLAAMVLTHPQRDHVGGAADVISR